MIPGRASSTLFPYTTLFRSSREEFLAITIDDIRPPEDVAALRHVLRGTRSEEHTSELQSHSDLVCRLLLEKKKSRPVAPEQSSRPTPARAGPDRRRGQSGPR